jgi:spermidine/putrescine transport system permease protein
MRLGWLVVIALILAFMLGPLVLVVLFAFSANPLISFPLHGLTLAWFGELAANREFWSALRNSLVIAAAVGVIATSIGTAAALALVRYAPAVRGVALTSLALPVMLPPLVLSVALVVFFLRVATLPLSLATVIAGHVLITLPFVVLVVLARLAQFDLACVEAARDLGATPLQTFRRVILPQIRTAVVGSALLAMAISLDDFVIALFTIGSGNTLSTFVWGRIRTSLDPSINAIATILLTLTVGVTVLALRLMGGARGGAALSAGGE